KLPDRRVARREIVAVLRAGNKIECQRITAQRVEERWNDFAAELRRAAARQSEVSLVDNRGRQSRTQRAAYRKSVAVDAAEHVASKDRPGARICLELIVDVVRR